MFPGVSAWAPTQRHLPPHDIFCVSSGALLRGAGGVIHSLERQAGPSPYGRASQAMPITFVTLGVAQSRNLRLSGLLRILQQRPLSPRLHTSTLPGRLDGNDGLLGGTSWRSSEPIEVSSRSQSPLVMTGALMVLLCSLLLVDLSTSRLALSDSPPLRRETRPRWPFRLPADHRIALAFFVTDPSACAC